MATQFGKVGVWDWDLVVNLGYRTRRMRSLFRYCIEKAGGRVSAENGGTAVEAVRRAETEG